MESPLEKSERHKTGVRSRATSYLIGMRILKTCSYSEVSIRRVSKTQTKQPKFLVAQGCQSMITTKIAARASSLGLYLAMSVE